MARMRRNGKAVDMTEHRCPKPSGATPKAPREIPSLVQRAGLYVVRQLIGWGITELLDEYGRPFVHTTLIPKVSEFVTNFPYPPYW